MENCDDKAKVLASKYLFNEPWLTVREEKIELPNGVVVPKYYVLELSLIHISEPTRR